MSNFRWFHVRNNHRKKCHPSCEPFPPQYPIKIFIYCFKLNKNHLMAAHKFARTETVVNHDVYCHFQQLAICMLVLFSVLVFTFKLLTIKQPIITEQTRTSYMPYCDGRNRIKHQWIKHFRLKFPVNFIYFVIFGDTGIWMLDITNMKRYHALEHWPAHHIQIDSIGVNVLRLYRVLVMNFLANWLSRFFVVGAGVPMSFLSFTLHTKHVCPGMLPWRNVNDLATELHTNDTFAYSVLSIIIHLHIK